MTKKLVYDEIISNNGVKISQIPRGGLGRSRFEDQTGPGPGRDRRDGADQSR